MPDVFPRDDSQFVIWFSSFQSKIGGYAATLGLVAADVTAVQNDYAAVAYMVQQVEQIKLEVKERVSYKDLIKDGPIGATGGGFPGAYTPPAAPANVVAPGVVPRLRLLIKRIKAAPNYTEAIGGDLGIIARGTPISQIQKPTGGATALANSQVELKFVKRGYDGIQVESKRGSEANWSVLGNYLRSPVMDARAPLVAGQPEVRSYRYRYLRGNDVVGTVSDTYTVTTLL